MAAKKVDALEEKLEAEVGSLKATIDERFNTIQQQFSSLETMLLKLTELHLKSPPATSIGHGGMAGEGSGSTEPVVGDGAGVEVTGLGDSGAFGGETWLGQAGFRPERGNFGSGHGRFGGSGPEGGISDERGCEYDQNTVGQGEFWTGSSGFVEIGVDSGGWRPPMEQNWGGQTQFRADSRTQETTVMEYREKFELLSGRLGGIPEAILKVNFMKGLKPEIQASVRLLRPRGLGETMESAQMIEDENTAERVNRSNSINFSYRNSTPLVEQKTQTLEFQREFQSTPPGGQKTQMMRLQIDSQRDRVSEAQPRVTFKRLTKTEIQDKRAKGLCFRCDEKFSLGHCCKDKSLQVLTVCDAEDGGEEAEEEEATVYWIPP